MQQHAVEVRYACIDGAHFFTSDDGIGKGLCVANPDFDTAFAEVAQQLQELARLNHRVDADFVPGVSADDLKAWAQQQYGIGVPSGIKLLAASQWMKNNAAA